MKQINREWWYTQSAVILGELNQCKSFQEAESVLADKLVEAFDHGLDGTELLASQKGVNK